MDESQTHERNDRVIATRVSPALAAQVEAAAAKELLPISIFIRRLLHLHINGDGRAAA